MVREFFWCRFDGCLIASPARSTSEAQEDQARFSSFGSGRRLGPAESVVSLIGGVT
ncbi:hypothetical protein Bca4012_014991 [Brassica carinata]